MLKFKHDTPFLPFKKSKNESFYAYSADVACSEAE